MWHRQCSWHWVGSPLALWTWLWRCLPSHHSWSLCRSAPALCYCLCEWSGKCIYHLHYNQTEKQTTFYYAMNQLMRTLQFLPHGVISFPKDKTPSGPKCITTNHVRLFSLLIVWDAIKKNKHGKKMLSSEPMDKSLQLQVRPQFILWLAATVCALCCIPEYEASQATRRHLAQTCRVPGTAGSWVGFRFNHIITTTNYPGVLLEPVQGFIFLQRVSKGCRFFGSYSTAIIIFTSAQWTTPSRKTNQNMFRQKGFKDHTCMLTW